MRSGENFSVGFDGFFLREGGRGGGLCFFIKSVGHELIN